MRDEVTVVIVTSRDMEDQDLLGTIHAVEQQDYPRHLVDTNLVFNVGDQDSAALLRFGVDQSETEWVAFCSDGQPWPTDMLSRLFQMRPSDGEQGTAIVHSDGESSGVLWNREVFLRLH